MSLGTKTKRPEPFSTQVPLLEIACNHICLNDDVPWKEGIDKYYKLSYFFNPMSYKTTHIWSACKILNLQHMPLINTVN